VKVTNERSQPRQRSGLGWWLAMVTIGAIILAVGVYQVPQPWRGYLIGWLLFMFTLGLLLLRFFGHYFQYKMAKLSLRAQGKDPDVAYTIQREAPSRVGELKVIKMDAPKGGSRTL